ncbi:hypothetical protein [Fodinicola acaciae]|uniref:hypothetical protein n=1 Tax=Fodinicola acaciae TaxID=2681555 RepID=UPI0013D07FF3|nr:hypothetical protein [Fodinicola acaciae]
MIRTSLLTIHILSGATGMLLGAFVMWRDSRLLRGGPVRTVSGRVYLVAVLVVCLSAAVLCAWFRHDLWWLVPVAAASYALAWLGRHAAAHRFRHWSHAYVHGQGGSYIALTTALIVVALTVDGPVGGAWQLLPWLLPTAIGTPLLEVWRRRLIPAAVAPVVRAPTRARR